MGQKYFIVLNYANYLVIYFLKIFKIRKLFTFFRLRKNTLYRIKRFRNDVFRNGKEMKMLAVWYLKHS
jgi:hypothetical protein